MKIIATLTCVFANILLSRRELGKSALATTKYKPKQKLELRNNRLVKNLDLCDNRIIKNLDLCNG